jgi:hypothetical protein
MTALDDHRHAAEDDDHARRDVDALVRGELASADVTAVGAAEVAEHEPVADLEQRMIARQCRVVDPNLAIEAATDHHLAGGGQAKRLCPMTRDDEQLKADRPPEWQLWFSGFLEHATFSLSHMPENGAVSSSVRLLALL